MSNHDSSKDRALNERSAVCPITTAVLRRKLGCPDEVRRAALKTYWSDRAVW